MGAIRELLQVVSNSLRWWVIIAPWEQGLRVRGGKTAKLLSSGIHFRVPFWDLVFIQPTRIRVTSTPSQTLVTADGKILTLQLLLTFRVGDLLRLYEHLHSPTDTINGFAMGAASEFVESNQSDVVTPSAVAKHVRSAVADKIQGYGIDDLDAQLSSFVYVPKAYRLITGSIEASIWGGDVSMADDRTE